jgi:HSP20 family molecular chaperone IbpA
MNSLVEDFFRRRPSSTHRQSFLDVVSRRTRAAFGAIPIVHVIETDRAYEITSELPGEMDEKNVEVRFCQWGPDDQGGEA